MKNAIELFFDTTNVLQLLSSWTLTIAATACALRPHAVSKTRRIAIAIALGYFAVLLTTGLASCRGLPSDDSPGHPVAAVHSVCTFCAGIHFVVSEWILRTHGPREFRSATWSAGLLVFTTVFWLAIGLSATFLAVAISAPDCWPHCATQDI